MINDSYVGIWWKVRYVVTDCTVCLMTSISTAVQSINDIWSRDTILQKYWLLALEPSITLGLQP